MLLLMSNKAGEFKIELSLDQIAPNLARPKGAQGDRINWRAAGKCLWRADCNCALRSPTSGAQQQTDHMSPSGRLDGRLIAA